MGTCLRYLCRRHSTAKIVALHGACWKHAVTFTAHRYLSNPDRVMTFRNEDPMVRL